MKRNYPYLHRFTGDSAVLEMLRQTLQNARDVSKNKQGRRGGRKQQGNGMYDWCRIKVNSDALIAIINNRDQEQAGGSGRLLNKTTNNAEKGTHSRQPPRTNKATGKQKARESPGPTESSDDDNTTMQEVKQEVEQDEEEQEEEEEHEVDEDKSQGRKSPKINLTLKVCLLFIL